MARYKKNCIIDAISCLAYYLIQDASGTRASERLAEMKKRKLLNIENKKHEDWIWEMAEKLAYPPQELWK